MMDLKKQLRQIHNIINRAKIGYAVIMLVLLTVVYCYNVDGDSQAQKWEKSPFGKLIVNTIPSLVAVLIGVPTTFFINEWLRPSKDDEGNLVKYFPLALDFSTGVNQDNFKSCLEKTSDEALFMANTFRDNILPNKELIFKKLSEGVDITFLSFNPKSAYLDEVSTSFIITSAALEKECLFSIETLTSLRDEYIAKKKLNPRIGELKIKLFNEVLKSRVYMYDPHSSAGMIFLVPYSNRTKSPEYSGFLIPNSHETRNITTTYLKSFENLIQNSKDL